MKFYFRNYDGNSYRARLGSSGLFYFFLIARFIVHVRRPPGVVALQNVGNTSHWLCVDGGITRAGDGGRCCEFYVKEIRKKFGVTCSHYHAAFVNC